MGIRNNNRKVDFDKLLVELRKRGIRATEASEAMGRSSSYLAGMRKNGHLPEATIIMLDKLWNIKYEDIKPSETTTEKPSEAKTEDAKITITHNELREIITESIKDAFTWYANL